MLLKTLFLLFIAWYVFRAAGNLINAARTDRQQMSTNDGPDIRSNPTPKETSRQSSQTPLDVEDARFQDL